MADGVVPEQTWTPGKTMPKLVPIERDYRQVGYKFDRMGPLLPKAGLASKGVAYNVQEAYEQLGDLNGRAPMDGNAGEGMPLCDTAIKAANMALRFSGTTNARWPFRAPHAGKRVGNEMAFLAEGDEEKKITYRTPSCSRAASSPAPSGRAPSTAVAATAPSCRTSSAASRGTRSRVARSSTSTTTG